jgi:hypothetical protein
LTPATLQLPSPVGVKPVVGPATEAVNVKLDPNKTLVALEVTVTIGINFVTVMCNMLLGPPAK